MTDLAGLRHVRYVLSDNPVTAGAFALFGLFLRLVAYLNEGINYPFKGINLIVPYDQAARLVG